MICSMFMALILENTNFQEICLRPLCKKKTLFGCDTNKRGLIQDLKRVHSGAEVNKVSLPQFSLGEVNLELFDLNIMCKDGATSHQNGNFSAKFSFKGGVQWVSSWQCVAAKCELIKPSVQNQPLRALSASPRLVLDPICK